MIVSTSQIAELFSVSGRTVRNWANKGCPCAGHGKWNVKEVMVWWLDNIYDTGKDTDDMQAAKTKYWTMKADNEEIKKEQQQQSLLPKDEIYRQWAARMAEYKNGCFGLENALPPLLEGKSQPEMRKIIYDHVWSMFNRVCREGKFCESPKKKKRGYV